MKKITTTFTGLVLFTALSVNSQTVFSEDFNGGNALSTWTLINVDGRTPAAAVNYVTDAWVVRQDFDTTGVGDSVAVSTSWYAPAGSSDDYMITPAITLTSNNFLFYDAKAQDPAFPDGYELRISTTTPTVAGLLANPALFTVGAENASWTRRSFDLSLYAGQTVYLGWHNNSNDQFLLLIDNIHIQPVIPNDATISGLDIANTQAVSSNVTVSGDVQNTGSSPLTSVVINWTADSGLTVNSDTLSLNLASFGTATFNHAINFTPTNPGTFSEISVWSSLPNGVPDVNFTDDTMSISVFVNNGMSVSKNVLLEEFTTAPCQFCPDGAVEVEQILATNPAVIAVGEHACFGTDAMTIPEASTYCSAFGSGAPTACVDRVLFDGEAQVAHGRGTWAANASSQAMLTSPVGVGLSGTYNSTTRVATINMDANFVDYGFPGDLRMTLFVVEDSVTGTGSGFDQVNFYHNQPNHPYTGAGNPIVGFVHKHVLRDVYPSSTAWGQSGVIPNPQPNTTYNQSFTFSINSNWKRKDISFVGFVSYFNSNTSQREVVNVEEITLNNIITSLGEVRKDGKSLTIYPNPTSEITNFEFNLSSAKRVSLTVRDITGKEVSSENLGLLGSGTQKLKLDVSDFINGIYFVSLQLDDEVITRKISVNK